MKKTLIMVVFALTLPLNGYAFSFFGVGKDEAKSAKEEKATVQEKEERKAQLADEIEGETAEPISGDQLFGELKFEYAFEKVERLKNRRFSVVGTVEEMVGSTTMRITSKNGFASYVEVATTTDVRNGKELMRGEVSSLEEGDKVLVLGALFKAILTVTGFSQSTSTSSLLSTTTISTSTENLIEAIRIQKLK